MPSRSYTPPNEWVRSDGVWPDGPFRTGAPPYVAALASFTVRLREAIDGESLRTIARHAGMSHASLSRILRGETVPDTAALAALESALHTGLWSNQDT